MEWGDEGNPFHYDNSMYEGGDSKSSKNNLEDMYQSVPSKLNLDSDIGPSGTNMQSSNNN